MNIYLEHALGYGVTDEASVVVLPPLLNYNKLKEEQKTLTKQAFLGPLAAFLEASLIGLAPEVGTGNAPIVVALAKLTPTGEAGSLTIQNGIITGVVTPT